LHDYFPLDSELAELISLAPPDQALEKIVTLAKERGGHDNITGIIVDVVEGNASIEEEADEARRQAIPDAVTSAEGTPGVPHPVGDEPTMPSPSSGDPAKAAITGVKTPDKTES
jgi:hypothetical protein